MQEEITDLISQYLGLNLDFQMKLFYSVVVVIILLLLRFFANRLFIRRIEDSSARYRWRKSTGYFFWTVGIIIIGLIWLRGAGSVATYLGLVSAALVIALQDPISNFVGWLFIVSRRPFEIEDRIEIGQDAGDVIDIRFFQFTLMEIGHWVDADQSTGRVLHVPNRKVFVEHVANYTTGFSFLWHEIPVVVTFESDWRKAKNLLLEIGNKHSVPLNESTHERLRSASKRFLIYYKNLTPIVYTKVVDHGVTLTIRYLTRPRRRRNTEEAIWEEILETFAQEPTLDFAYPTQRLYYHPSEGSQEPRPPAPPDQEMDDTTS